MNQARFKNTGELLDAEDLRIIDDPKSIDFICAGENCGVPVFPCSFKPINKPRPYFKVGSNEHLNNCSYSSFLDYLKLGYKTKLTDSDLVKMEFPSKLKLYTKPKDDDTPQNRTGESEQGSTSSRRNFVNQFGDEKKSNKVVTTINQIVDFYLSCPYNRDVELDLLGTKKEYYKLFLNVTTAKNVNPKELRIYYAHVDFRKGGKSLIKRDTNNYLIKLYEGVKTKETNFQEYEPFHVLIKKDQISKAKFNRIQYEKSQVIEEYISKFKGGKAASEAAFIFFVAYPPSKNEPTIFEALHGMIVSRYTIIRDTILD